MPFDAKKYSADYCQRNKEKAKERTKKWREDNRERYLLQNKTHYQNNKEAILNQCKEYRQKNIEKVKERDRKKYLKNRKKIIDRSAQYNKQNPNRPAYMREYVKARSAKDEQFKIQRMLRGRLSQALKGIEKKPSSRVAIANLGCSVLDARRHLENQFVEGMSWENWGKGDGKCATTLIFGLCGQMTI